MFVAFLQLKQFYIKTYLYFLQLSRRTTL